MTNSEKLLSYINSAKDAILDVTDETIGGGDDPLTFVISCFRSQVDKIKELSGRLDYTIKALDRADRMIRNGECRFNCRTGKESFLAGFDWALASRSSMDMPRDRIGAYHEWKKRNG